MFSQLIIRVIVVIVFYQWKLRAMVWRTARHLRPFDRLSSSWSEMFSQLIIRVIVVTVVYLLKFRLMVWRAARHLRPCDRLSSPPLVMFSHLIIRANETSPSCDYSLPLKVKSDGMESYKVSKTLWQNLESSVSNFFTSNNDISSSLHFSYLLKCSWRLFTTFIPFRLFLISFMSFFFKVSLKFTFISSKFFPLTYNLELIGQFSDFVS